MNWLPFLAIFVGGLAVGASLLFVMQSLWRRLNQSSTLTAEPSQVEPQSHLIEELDDLRTRLRTAASWHVREERARLAVESELNALQTARDEMIQATKREREQAEAALLVETESNESLKVQLADVAKELTRIKQASLEATQALEQKQQAAAQVAYENSENRIAALTTQLKKAHVDAELQGERLAATQQQVDALQGRLDELLSLAGQFPIQATEIHRLTNRLKAVSDERDGLRSQLRKLARSFLEIRRRYQFVLQKLRTLLAKKEEIVEQHSLATEASVAELSDQPASKDEIVDDKSFLNGQVEPEVETEIDLAAELPSLISANGTNAAEQHMKEPVSDSVIDENAPTELDRLSQIRGIGPTYEMRLHQAGIRTFEQLIALSPEKIREIVKLRSWHKSDPAEWIQQATTLL